MNGIECEKLHQTIDMNQYKPILQYRLVSICRLPLCEGEICQPAELQGMRKVYYHHLQRPVSLSM
jgi:hypothetical protein